MGYEVTTRLTTTTRPDRHSVDCNESNDLSDGMDGRSHSMEVTESGDSVDAVIEEAVPIPIEDDDRGSERNEESPSQSDADTLDGDGPEPVLPDLSIFTKNSHFCRYNGSADIYQCDYILRLKTALRFYASLDVSRYVNHQDIFSAFCNEHYRELFNDWIHVLQTPSI